MIAKRKGDAVRRGLKEAWSKGASGGLATLTNYISDYFSAGYAETFAGTMYYPGSSGAIALTMLDNNGNPISYPSLLGANLDYS